MSDNNLAEYSAPSPETMVENILEKLAACILTVPAEQICQQI